MYANIDAHTWMSVYKNIVIHLNMPLLFIKFYRNYNLQYNAIAYN